MNNLVKFVLLISCAIPASRLLAQDPAPKPPEHFYRLVFQIEETDAAGKVINSRSYATSASTGNSRGWPIKTGNKIPLQTGDKGIQYLDVGVNLEIQDAVDVGPNLHLIVKAEVSSLAPEQNSVDPVIRQNSWGAEVLVPIGKPSVIFSSDNLENKGRTQVRLTATPIN